MAKVRITFVGTMGPRPGGAVTAGGRESVKETDDVKNSTGTDFKTAPGHTKSFGALLRIEGGPTIALDYGRDMRDVQADLILLSSVSPHAASGLTSGISTPIFVGPGSAAELPDDLRQKVQEVKRSGSSAGVKFTFYPVVGSMRSPWFAVEVETPLGRVLWVPRLWDFKAQKQMVLPRVGVYIGDLTQVNRDVRRNVNGQIVGHASAGRQLKWAAEHNVPVAVFTSLGQDAVGGNPQQQLQSMSGQQGPIVRVPQDGGTLTFEEQFREEVKVPEAKELEVSAATIRKWNPRELSDKELAEDWAALRKWWLQSANKEPGHQVPDYIVDASRVAVREYARRTKAEMPLGETVEEMQLISKALQFSVGGSVSLPAGSAAEVLGGSKKEITSTEALKSTKPLSLCIDEGGVCVGIVLVGEPRKLSGKDLTDEIKSRFPGIQEAFVHDVRTAVPLDDPADSVGERLVSMENGPAKVAIHQGGIPKKEVTYSKAKKPTVRSCGRCRHFNSAASNCQIVKGFIDPAFRCDLFDLDVKLLADMRATAAEQGQEVDALVGANEGRVDSERVEVIYPTQRVVGLIDGGGTRWSRPFDEQLDILRRKGSLSPKPEEEGS